MYLECPVGRAALTWLARLWYSMDAGPGLVPLDPRVWLADDASVWRPTQPVRDLWVVLRVAMLRAVWATRGAARQQVGPYTLAAVVARFVADVRKRIGRDWLQLAGDVRQQAGVSPTWFRGRQPGLDLEAFRSRWCWRGLLAVVHQPPGRPPDLELRLTIGAVPGMVYAPPGPGGPQG
jgi:hypothetical protein